MSLLKEHIDSREEIELLVFTTMGVRMGIDTRRIESMLKPEDALSQGLSMISIHEKLHFRGTGIRYQEPHVLVMRDENACGIVIDHPDEIALIKTESIRQLPEIISLSGGAKEIWGAVLEENGITFLLDCGKIAGCGHN